MRLEIFDSPDQTDEWSKQKQEQKRRSGPCYCSSEGLLWFKGWFYPHNSGDYHPLFWRNRWKVRKSSTWGKFSHSNWLIAQTHVFFSSNSSWRLLLASGVLWLWNIQEEIKESIRKFQGPQSICEIWGRTFWVAVSEMNISYFNIYPCLTVSAL